MKQTKAVLRRLRPFTLNVKGTAAILILILRLDNPLKNQISLHLLKTSCVLALECAVILNNLSILMSMRYV